MALPPYADPSLPARERAADLVSRLDAEEKLGLMSSAMRAVPRLGLAEFRVGGEAAHGLQTPEGPSTLFPQTIGLACSWDEGLLEAAGELVGDQARAYYRRRGGVGGLCLWAPTVDMERDPRWGRTEEAYGEDPTLAGRLSAAYARGMQGRDPARLKTVPTPKHFYGNNNEADRMSSSSAIDPRSKREYYLRAFEPTLSAAGAGAASFMTSYNAINGVPAIFNPDIGNIVRGEWGFEGFVVCDAGALEASVSQHRYCPDLAHAAALALKAGVDNFTEPADLVRGALREALDTGLIAWAEIDRALERSLSVRVRLGQLDPPEADPYAGPGSSAIWSPRGAELALRAAREAIVLLENRGERPILPLDAETAGKVAVIGPLAEAVYRDWYAAHPPYRVNPLAAIAARVPEDRLVFEDGCDLVALRAADGRWVGVRSMVDRSAAADRPASAGGESFRMCDWGWGNVTFRATSNGEYLSSGERGIEAAAPEVWGWFVRERFSLEAEGPESRKAAGAERGPVRLRAWDGRPVSLDAGRRLVAPAEGAEAEAFELLRVRDGKAEAVRAAARAYTVIVFVGNHPLLAAKEEIDRVDIALAPDQESLVESVIEANPRTIVVVVGSYPFAVGAWKDRAAAVLYTAHGGQEAGNAIADALFGDCDPAGRLPMTWYRSLDQLGGIMDYDIAAGERTYLYFPGDPLYSFGYGRSYARFGYSWPDGPESARVLKGGAGYSVEFDLKNLSERSGDEVVQLYIRCSGSRVRRPRLQLADFARVSLSPGESRRLRLAAKERDFRYWDEASSAWKREAGEWELLIGASSDDTRLSTVVHLSEVKN
jgi:beta-glucosidase